MGRDGGIGIHGSLKSFCSQEHAGSNPAPGTQSAALTVYGGRRAGLSVPIAMMAFMYPHRTVEFALMLSRSGVADQENATALGAMKPTGSHGDGHGDADIERVPGGPDWL